MAPGAATTEEDDMSEDLRGRNTEEVFDDHLRLAAEHRFDEEIERNIAPHRVILERTLTRDRDRVLP